MERERRDPLWADQSFRTLPNWVTEKEVEVNHVHIETSYASQDINVALPVQRF